MDVEKAAYNRNRDPKRAAGEAAHRRQSGDSLRLREQRSNGSANLFQPADRVSALVALVYKCLLYRLSMA